MSDVDILKYLLLKIEFKAKLPEYTKWTNSNYTELSELIYTDTGVLLSRNTLKNIVSKIEINDSKYSPQQTTKDALCQFMGYENWRDLKINHASEILNHGHIVQKSGLLNGSLNKWWILGGLFAVILIFMWFLISQELSPPEKLNYVFEVESNIGIAPHTLSVNYDFSSFNAEEVYVDFNTFSAAGKYELKPLNNKKGIENFCYHHPGYYSCDLYVNEKRVKRNKILIYSEDWYAFVYDAKIGNMDRPKAINLKKVDWPVFISFDNIISDIKHNGVMTVTPEQVAQINDFPKNYKTEFGLFKEFELDGDNCALEVAFNNSYFGEETYCYSAQFTVVCENGELSGKIVQPGCKLYAKYNFSEIHSSGINSEIPGFEYDFQKQRVFGLNVKNKNVTLTMDGVPFHTNTYKKNIGKVVGLKFTFKGAAAVDYVQLKDGSGDINYFNDFDL